MPTPVQEIRVFMASPGDLEDEREALRGVERRINAAFQSTGLRMTISGWEEVQPEYGRPQELINPLVHDCEVFVGLLNTRWGSATGTHDSGFAEEFEIAIARRESSDKPHVGMFFRTIDEERLADKGPQLLAVLAFQERVRQERLALYKTFGSVDQLCVEVYDFLTQIALRSLAGAFKEPKALEAGSRGTERDDIDLSSTESTDTVEGHGPSTLHARGAARVELDSAQEQIVTALGEFGALFSRAEISEEARDRVTLAGAAFAVDEVSLGVHHVNRLFRARTRLQLTLGEFRTWFRTYLADVGNYAPEDRTVPFWGLLTEFDEKFFQQLGTMLHDADSAVVRGALRIVTVHQIRVKWLWPIQPAEGADHKTDVENAARGWEKMFASVGNRNAAMNYIATVATASDSSFLAEVSASERLSEPTRKAVEAFSKFIRNDFSGLPQILPSKYASDISAIREGIVKVLPRLSPESLEELLSSHPSLAASAAAQLVAESEFSEPQIRKAVGLNDSEVTAAMVSRASNDHEWAYSVIKQLRSSNTFSHYSLIAKLLAVSVPHDFLEALDLEETFDVSYWTAATIASPNRHVAMSRAILDGEPNRLAARADELRAEYSSLADHVADTAAATACVTLSLAEVFDDADVIRVVRELLKERTETRVPALHALIRMLQRIEEVPARRAPNLGDLEVLTGAWVEEEVAAITSSPLMPIVASLWKVSSIDTLRHAAVIWSLRRPDSTDLELEEELYNDEVTVRLAALDELIKRWQRNQLEDLLNRYDKQDRPYWYNIVTTLDGHLYGLKAGGSLSAN